MMGGSDSKAKLYTVAVSNLGIKRYAVTISDVYHIIWLVGVVL